MELEKIMEWVLKADENEISVVMDMLLKKEKRIHPDWETMYLSFPLKQPEECKQILAGTWENLCKIMKN